jgi:diacylglycerol O-acyltransferase / wax synthase
MASGDAAWLHMDRPVNELIVNAVLWFDEPIDDALLRTVLDDRLLARHPRFRRRVDDEGGAAWWVDDDAFDLTAHLSRERLAEPGDLTALTDTVTRLINQPLRRDRPLWQIHAVDGYGGNGTALVARIHHCIADGVALFRALLSLSDEAQDGALGGAPQRSAPAGSPAPCQRVRRHAVHAGRAARGLGGLVALPPDSRTALRGPLGTAKTAVWSTPIPVETMRAASRAAGGTINDLALAALSGALRRLLEPAGRVRDVRAVLPVNLRPLDADAGELGNRFGLVFLRLPVATLDPRARVAAIQRRTAALKRSATALVALRILELAGHGPTALITVLISIFSAKGSVVVTNVPGPTAALHLGGHRLAGAIAWPPQSGSIGVGVSVISYAGNVVLGVMADDRRVPDAQRLLATLVAELSDLGAPVS